jgi:hypothetical protein
MKRTTIFGLVFLGLSCRELVACVDFLLDQEEKPMKFEIKQQKRMRKFAARPSEETSRRLLIDFLLYFNFSSFGTFNFVLSCLTAFTSGVFFVFFLLEESNRRRRREAIFPMVSSKLGNQKPESSALKVPQLALE